jgi:hypothetical protein
MHSKGIAVTIGITVLLGSCLLPILGVYGDTSSQEPEPPAEAVKLIFIHHSCGTNWLKDSSGGLGVALRDSNYYVSDTNYGWGPDGIGDSTDIGHWWTWFVGPARDTYTSALYDESGQNTSYSRLPQDPGGENEIIMFKSCYPNSSISGTPDDAPTVGDNPLRGENCGSPYLTVANTKGIYNDLLPYFASRQDKLFVVITAPPLVDNRTTPARAVNARALNNWLVNDWLNDYPHDNVAVFDFYNALTSNGGNAQTNDLGAATGNHHRWWNGAVQHVQSLDSDTAAYGSSSNDSHPSAAGNQKASAEFVPLLNCYYHLWKTGEEAATPTVTSTPSTPMPTTTPTPTAIPTQTERLLLPLILKG